MAEQTSPNHADEATKTKLKAGKQAKRATMQVVLDVQVGAARSYPNKALRTGCHLWPPAAFGGADPGAGAESWCRCRIVAHDTGDHPPSPIQHGEEGVQL